MNEDRASGSGVGLRFRTDLSVLPRQARGKKLRFYITDQTTGRSFDIGEREDFVRRHLDGATSLEQIERSYELAFGDTIAPAELRALVEQFAAEGCLEDVPARSATIPEVLDPQTFLPYARFRLTRGDRFVSWLTERMRWVFTRPFQVVAVAWVLLAANVLMREWPLLLLELDYAWGLPYLLTVILVTAAMVHAPRALAQAVMCKRAGGYVSEIGVMFLYYVVPGLYCRFTDMRWLGDRSRVLRTLAVGVGYQVIVGATAIVAWSISTPGSLVHGIWLALAFGSVFGLVFLVLNPLIKLDGYHMLATWLEIPHLRERSLAVLGCRLAGRPQPEPLTPRERRGFLLFGAVVAAFTLAYMVALLTLAGIGLTRAFEGVGLILLVAAAAFAFRTPVMTLLAGRSPLVWLRETGRGLEQRWGRRLWYAAGALLLLLLPYPYETGGPFTVKPAMRADIVCEIEGGSIAEVFVIEGERVTAGQPLAQIDQREYLRNLALTEASLAETQAKLRLMQKQLAILDTPPDIETIRALEAEARRLETTRTDFRAQIELTVLRSPIDGIVVTPNIAYTLGYYVRKGEAFATVEKQDMVRVEIHVPEGDVPMVKLGARVHAKTWAYPGEVLVGTVARIAPTAATQLAPSKLSTDNTVRVVADMPNADGRFLSQITGFAKIKTRWLPVGYVLSRLVLRWLRVQFWYWIP